MSRGSLQDYVFEHKPSGGPFESVQEFHDWFSQLPQDWLPESDRYPDPYRPYLPDDAAITFTHGDLHRGNMIVALTGLPRILSIIDWKHAGWYPDYWEYCKAAYTSSIGDEWREEWVPKILVPRLLEHEIFAEYCMAMGAV